MKKTNLKRIFILILFLLIIPIFSTWILVAQPTFTKNSPSHLTLKSSKLKAHVLKLSKDYSPRNHTNTKNLDRCAQYILSHFKKAGADTSTQEYEALGKKYQNVIGFFGNETGERIVIGAHYDARINTPGADDNAERLDYELMGKAVIQVFEAIKGLAKGE
jgi:hypothetical protein